jgi:hypothetical protein
MDFREGDRKWAVTLSEVLEAWFQPEVLEAWFQPEVLEAWSLAEGKLVVALLWWVVLG